MHALRHCSIAQVQIHMRVEHHSAIESRTGINWNAGPPFIKSTPFIESAIRRLKEELFQVGNVEAIEIMKDRNLLRDAVIGAVILYALFLAFHFRHPYLLEQAGLEAMCAFKPVPSIPEQCTKAGSVCPASSVFDNCFFYSRFGLIYDNSAVPSPEATQPTPTRNPTEAGRTGAPVIGIGDALPPRVAGSPRQAADPTYNAVPARAVRSLFGEKAQQ